MAEKILAPRCSYWKKKLKKQSYLVISDQASKAFNSNLELSENIEKRSTFQKNFANCNPGQMILEHDRNLQIFSFKPPPPKFNVEIRQILGGEKPFKTNIELRGRGREYGNFFLETFFDRLDCMLPSMFYEALTLLGLESLPGCYSCLLLFN